MLFLIPFSSPLLSSPIYIYTYIYLMCYSGREQCSIFLTLPSKKKFPDYYIVITRPMSFQCIQERLKKNSSDGGYTHSTELIEAYRLIFENAKTYNEPGSIVYEDADVLEASLIFDMVYTSSYVHMHMICF